MTRPTTLPQSWATNVNFAAGPNIGTPTKVAASGGRVADGWRNTEVPPSQEQNYWQNLISRWALYQADFIGEGNIATMVARVPTFEGAVFHVHDDASSVLDGWFFWTTSTMATADETFWIFSGTGGQWVNLLWPGILLGGPGIAGVGVIPGVAGSVAGRIHKSLVPFGYLTRTDISPFSIGNAAAGLTELINFNLGGSLLPGDIIQFRLPAIVGVTAGAPLTVTASAYISENNGSSYTSKSPGGASPSYRLSANASTVAVVLDFTHIVGSNSGVKVSVRSSSDGTNLLTMYSGQGLIEVSRP